MKTQQELDFLENYIPELANSAVKKAYLDTLSSGNSVVEVVGNKMYEIFPDEIEKEIKEYDFIEFAHYGFQTDTEKVCKLCEMKIWHYCMG